MNKIIIDIISNDNDGQRMLFRQTENSDIIIMYDNGSNVPVWTTGEDMLQADFPNAEKMNYKFIISGFGGKESDYEIANAYVIPSISIEHGDKSITIHNLYCAVVDRKDMIASLILPGNIFCGLIITEDRRKPKQHKLIIKYNRKDRYVVFQQKPLTFDEKLLLGLKESDEIIHYTSSFTSL